MQLNVLSLNCWGAPFSKDYDARIKEVFGLVSSEIYDIILLQEMFREKDIEMFIKRLTFLHRYCIHFKSSFIGSGLMVISKHEILEHSFTPYIDQGTPFDYGFDWYANKGIGYCMIKYQGKIIHVFNTHACAFYDWNSFLGTRTTQMFQLTKLVKLHTKPTDFIIIGGDFNTEYIEPPFKYLTESLFLEKSHECLTRNNITEYSTSNSTYNKYHKKNENPHRIDYILHNSNFMCTDYDVLCDEMNLFSKNYSDHEPVFASLQLIEQSDLPTEYTYRGSISEEIIHILTGYYEKLKPSHMLYAQLVLLLLTTIALIICSIALNSFKIGLLTLAFGFILSVDFFITAIVIINRYVRRAYVDSILTQHTEQQDHKSETELVLGCET